MSLSEAQKKYLRGLGHQLKPTIMVGNGGLTDGLRAEFDATLGHHELIKVKVRVGERSQRDAIIAELCAGASAELVKRTGNVALLYRENADKKRINLPAR